MTLQEYNDLFKEPFAKRIILFAESGTLIEGENIVSEQMSLESSLCSDNNLRYGACESTCFRVQIADMNHSFVGEWLDVFMDSYTEDALLVDNSGNHIVTDSGDRIKVDEPTENRIHLGRFKVFSDKPTNDRRWRDLTCYDVMYDILNADVLPWYKTLTFPMTMKQFRDSFFSALGIVQETTTLINDSFSIQGGFSSESIMSGKTIIESICELNGVFGHISNDGVFKYVNLNNAESLTLDYYVDGTGAYEDYVTETITGVIARGSEDDVGTSVGTMDNAYVIQANPLTYGAEGTPALTTALTNIFNNIKLISFIPFTVDTYGNPMLPLGTRLTVVTRNKTIVSNVINKTMIGIQGLIDTLSARSEEKQPTQVNSIREEIIRTKGKVHEIKVTVDELNSTIYDEDTGLVSQIQQMSDEIVLKVKSDGTMVKVKLGVNPSQGSSFQVKADNIEFISNGKIELTSNTLEINSTNFKVTSSGSITANSGTIGGWTLSANKIYGGNSTEGVAVVQRPRDSITWVFGAGGTSHDSYSDCKFKVAKTGSVYCRELNITEGSVSGGQGTAKLTKASTSASLAFFNPNSTSTNILLEGLTGGGYFNGNLAANGTKSRVVFTEDYGDRLLYCYETASPMFGDLGEGQIAEDGMCYVSIDSVFTETVDVSNLEYQVYLQRYGEGDCYVAERKATHFIVKGTVGLKFGWEIKAKQSDFSQTRLGKKDDFAISNINYANDAQEHLKMIQEEREVA